MAIEGVENLGYSLFGFEQEPTESQVCDLICAMRVWTKCYQAQPDNEDLLTSYGVLLSVLAKGVLANLTEKTLYEE
jgi:hypothetical protein